MIKSFVQMLYAVVATLAVLIWLMQPSLNSYWQETYHREPLATALQDTAWMRSGPALQQRWMANVTLWTASLADFDRKVIATIDQIWFGTSANASAPDHTPALVPQEIDQPAVIDTALINTSGMPEGQPSDLPSFDYPQRENDDTASGVLLSRHDKVLFVGDSLMQGVAPHIRSVLFKQGGIEGLDLSKQSTGLAYTGFFNWPKTVADAFAQHPDIKLMVVFLGPNDPWDFPLKKGQPYLRFKSAEWEAAYRERIQSLLNTARLNNARVLWLEVPVMKKKQLNEGMTYLNDLYASEVLNAGGIFIPTNAILGSDGSTFEAYATINDKKTKVRVDDGVHFTLSGQRAIASKVLTYIQITAAK